MPFCPNPNCPHWKRLGEPAEFRKEVTVCSDCGTPLSESAPLFEPIQETKMVMGWNCPECGLVNPEDMAKCLCGYDANRPVKTTSSPGIDVNEKAVSQVTKRIKSYSTVIKRTIIFTIINFFVANFLFSFLPFNLGNILFNVGRIFIIFYAGWLVIKNNVGGLWKAAATGPILYFIDHVMLKGGIFLLMFLFNPKGQGLLAVGGVLISYVMFVPISLAVGVLGGLFAKSKKADC